jgi:hypothetical protein
MHNTSAAIKVARLHLDVAMLIIVLQFDRILNIGSLCMLTNIAYRVLIIQA